MGTTFPKPCFCPSGAQNAAVGTMKASLRASVMDLCTPKKSRDLCACELLSGQNELRKIAKMLIFTICWRDTQTEDRRARQDPPSRGKKSSPWALLRTPHSNKVTVAHRRRKKWLLHHFQPPHLPGMCQERILLRASCGSWALLDGPRGPCKGGHPGFCVKLQANFEISLLSFRRAKWSWWHKESVFGSICDGS